MRLLQFDALPEKEGLGRSSVKIIEGIHSLKTNKTDINKYFNKYILQISTII